MEKRPYVVEWLSKELELLKEADSFKPSDLLNSVSH
jgi:hypothetical protein